MASRRPLRTHLLATHSSQGLTTACGVKAVPNAGRHFAPPSLSGLYEGVVAASVGVGIVVATALNFDLEAAPGGLCATCSRDYARGGGL